VTSDNKPLGPGDHLYLIDGSGYIFRAYHALPPLTRKRDGMPVGAVSGFCNMLYKLLEDTKAGETVTHIAVIFDSARKTFRNDIYPDYKANRDEPPEDLKPQFGLIRDAVRAFNVPAIDMEGFDKTVGVLLKGVVLGMKHAAPIMKEQKSGSIISTASVAGLQGGFGPHIYSACKAAVVHLTKTVALELGKDNIRVNAICPGGIATSIFGRGMGLPTQLADQSAKLMENVLDKFQPIKRSGLPSDIARTALFLASDDSTFVSGQAIAVDGALTAGREQRQGVGRIGESMAKQFGDLLKS
jgi:NAD(P)-dependent dehydrogenase (short-subunit alcohol dehydrogenase family)